MTNLYAVMMTIRYEGTELINIFANEDDAIEYARRCEACKDAVMTDQSFTVEPKPLHLSVPVDHLSRQLDEQYNARYDEYEQY